MIDFADFRRFALSLPETDEKPDAAITAFRVKKKFFATINPPERRATLRLSPEPDRVFQILHRRALPVPW